MNIHEIYNMATQRLELAKKTIMSKDLPLATRTLETLQSALNITPTPPILTDFCAFAERVVGWIPLNPNDLQRVRAIIAAYHLPDYDNYVPETTTLDLPHPIAREYLGDRIDYRSENRLPTKNGLITLFDTIIQSQNQFIALSGRRGSGKTMALNFFLTTAHRALCSKGVLWLRTDIAKIWAYPADFLNISQYTMLHSIFIGLRYAKDDQNLKALDKEGEKFGEHLAALHNTNKHSEIWKRLVSAYSNSIRMSRHDPYGKPVADFLAEGKQLITEYGDFAIQALFKELIAFLRESAHAEGRTLRILMILDGVDNIRIGAHQDRYFILLREIIDLFSDVPLKMGDIFILVARPETFNDLSLQKTMMQNGLNVPAMFNIDTDFVQELVKRKTDAIENPVEYFQSKAELLTGKKFIDTNKSRSFNRSVKHLFHRFKDAGKMSHNMSFNNETIRPIDLLFDGNMRSLLRNIIRAHYYKTRLSTSVSPVRSLLEGSVLAGCNSMPMNFDDNVHGHWCPNLFEYATLENGHWTGLIVIRLIQLLDAVSVGVTREDAIVFVHHYFGYSRVQCETAFQAASEFSLIQGKGFRVDRFDVDNARPMNARLFATTIKGRYILNLAFKDCAVFYFMAAGTPLDLVRVKNKGINLDHMAHSMDMKRHFFRAVILSGLVLWAHIYTANRKELSTLKDINLCVDGNPISPSVFELTDIDLWPSCAMNLLRRLSKNDLEIISDTCTKYASY